MNMMFLEVDQSSSIRQIRDQRAKLIDNDYGSERNSQQITESNVTSDHHVLSKQSLQLREHFERVQRAQQQA